MLNHFCCVNESLSLWLLEDKSHSLFVYCLGLLLKSQVNLILLTVRSGWITPGNLSPVSKWPIHFSQSEGVIRKSGKS